MVTDNKHYFIKRHLEKLYFLIFLLILVSCSNNNVNKNKAIQDNICNSLDLSFNMLHYSANKKHVVYYSNLNDSNRYSQKVKNVLRESCFKSHDKVEKYLNSLNEFIKDSSAKEIIIDSVKLFSLTKHFYRDFNDLYYHYQKDDLLSNEIKESSLNNDTIICNIPHEYYAIYLRKLKINAIMVYMIFQDLTYVHFGE